MVKTVIFRQWESRPPLKLNKGDKIICKEVIPLETEDYVSKCYIERTTDEEKLEIQFHTPFHKVVTKEVVTEVQLLPNDQTQIIELQEDAKASTTTPFTLLQIEPVGDFELVTEAKELGEPFL